MAQYCRKEIKLYGYETKEMRNRQCKIKIKTNKEINGYKINYLVHTYSRDITRKHTR